MEIDLATFKKRSELIEAYESLEKERDYWREFAHDLEIKLQEHEGVKQTNEEAEIEFQKFWVAYGRKGNVKTTRKRYFNLPKAKKALAMDKVIAYVKSTPEKAFRKDGERWLLNECWNDEIVEAAQPFNKWPTAVRAATSVIEDAKTESIRLGQAAIARKANRNRKVKDILK